MLSENMYESVLAQSVLNEKQAQIYCACLRIGGGRVPEIAREAGIKRTTAYGILDELVKVGVINYVFKGKQKIFRAKDPKELIELLDEKRQRVIEVVPKLSRIFSARQLYPKIQFFEGKVGLKQIYADVLNCRSKKVCQIVTAKKHSELLGDAFVREYIRKRVAKGITAYDLHPKSGDIYDQYRGRENASLKRYVRYLPPQVFHAAMIIIYDNKVAMVSSRDENFAFLLESKEFSATLQAYFDFMWGLGSKEPEIN